MKSSTYHEQSVATENTRRYDGMPLRLQDNNARNLTIGQ